MLTQVHAYIIGDVIGVGFRAWTKIQTRFVGVNGWVRNNYERSDIFGPSGGVEAVFQGQQENVDKIIELMKTGSPISRVEDVQVFHEETKELFEDFEIRK